MAEKGKDEKEEEKMKHENPHLLGGGRFMAIFDYKIGDFWHFKPKSAHPVWLEPIIYVATAYPATRNAIMSTVCILGAL